MATGNNFNPEVHSPALSPVEQDRMLNSKLIELQGLFEISQILNSSLNLKSILDNMLLVPMGKMMLSKGIVLLNQNRDIYVVETLKGLARSLIGKQLHIETSYMAPIFVNEMDATHAGWVQFFQQLGIVILLPISSNKKNLGIIGFGGKIAGSAYDQPEIDFLNSLSNIAATSIENGLIFQELNAVNRKLDKKIQELNTLFEIGKELNSTLDSNKILNLLLYAIMGEMVVNRCAIMIRHGNLMELKLTKGIGQIEAEIQGVLTESLHQYFCELNTPMILTDTENMPPLLAPLQKIHFEVLVPMRIQAENQGIIMIGPKIIKQSFRADELEFLNTLGNAAMISLENARLFEETLEKQRMEEELNIAREIQQRLLPKEFPNLPQVEIAAINVSSRQVGGDYYDWIEIDAQHYALAIADVSGKGAPAALLMSNLQASLQAFLGANLPIADMIAKINNLAHRNTAMDRFITFFYGVLDLQHLTFTYCNAGHNPPYLWRADNTFQQLDAGGLLLGMFPNIPYQVATVNLHPDDWLVMYTDGVTEANNTQEEEFETGRLEQVIAANRTSTAQQMLDAILDAIHAFAGQTPQSDDITMITVKIKPSVA